MNFGLKVWNSIEFVLLTKQEIIVDEFCNSLPKLRDEIERFAYDTDYVRTSWGKINEFLSFRYAAGTVSVNVKDKLIKVLTNEAKVSIEKSQISILIFEALLITLQNTSMQNYYKSNVKEFAKFTGTIIQYLIQLLRSTEISSEQTKQYKQNIEQIVATMKSFIKQTPFLDIFKQAFADDILNILCELSISSLKHDIDCRKDFIAIVQELYFDGSHTKQLKQYFIGAKNQQDPVINEYKEIFDKPIHVFLSVCEVILLSFRNDTDMQQAFIQYLFNETDGKLVIRNDEVKKHINGLTILMLLLKKHDIPLNFEISSKNTNVKAHVYLGRQIKNAVNSYYNIYLYEILSLLCATIKLNPLILEYSACQIAVKFMLTAKTDKATSLKYEEFMYLLIEMYRKWNRGEKFISQLINNLCETLSTMKLSKKLKRSFVGSADDIQSSSKKLKKSNGEDFSMNSNDFTEKFYLDLFEQNILHECDGSPIKLDIPLEGKSNESWDNIAFAFTPTINNAFIRFISGLVSKPSLVVWKTLLFALKDYIQQLSSVDGKCTENNIFLIEISSALLSQYFSGSRLTEQSDKSWDAIEANRKITYEILCDFGHAILSQEHNCRIMNAFLKLCYSASNFDLLCWYYRPDSMQFSNESENTVGFDVKECAKNIHGYLTEKEWKTIEQQIVNFGKIECKINMNKIYLQRFKALQLLDDDGKSNKNIEQYALSTIFNDPEQISNVLNDKTLCDWFIGNLNFKQKQSVCELMLQSNSEIETLNTMNEMSNRDFIEILILTTYKSLVKILGNEKLSKYLSSMDFDSISTQKTNICMELSTIIEKQIMKPIKMDKKHISTHQSDISSRLTLLNNLPIGFCTQSAKEVFLLINISVYQYLNAVANTNFIGLTNDIIKGKYLF